MDGTALSALWSSLLICVFPVKVKTLRAELFHSRLNFRLRVEPHKRPGKGLPSWRPPLHRVRETGKPGPGPRVPPPPAAGRARADGSGPRPPSSHLTRPGPGAHCGSRQGPRRPRRGHARASPPRAPCPAAGSPHLGRLGQRPGRSASRAAPCRSRRLKVTQRPGSSHASKPRRGGGNAETEPATRPGRRVGVRMRPLARRGHGASGRDGGAA